MKNKEDIQKELQELSPFLSKLKLQEQKPEVPENYFHSLPDQVWEQIKLTPASERVVTKPGIWEYVRNTLQLLLQPRIAMSLATFVVLILAGIYLFQPVTTATLVEESLTAEEITKYINENIYEFDTEMLIQAMADLPSTSILTLDDYSEDEINQMMEEILKEADTKILEEM